MRTLTVFTASLFLMGCGQMNQATLQPSAQMLSVKTASKPRWHSIGQPGVLITPEGVEAIARERATSWSEDSELRFVAWGMVGNERLSAVNHSFYSPSKRQVMVVATFLKETQQKVVTYGDSELVKPMDALLPLSKIKLDAQAALTLAAPYFLPGNTNPLRMLTLTHPRKFAYPLWSVASGGNMVHVNASTGTVIGVKPFKSEYPLAWRDQRR